MFTPVETAVGALLLHQASSILLYQNGDVLGASGFIRQLFFCPTRETFAFFMGMATSYLPLMVFAPQLITHYPTISNSIPDMLGIICVGALIGLGTKMSAGCTSGHMLCGLSRLSGRSALAVAIFFPVAILTHHLGHPTLYTENCLTDLPCYYPTYPSLSIAASFTFVAAISMSAARSIPKLLGSTSTSQKNNNTPTRKAWSIARESSRFFSGLLFALGLHISQMAQPTKVASFLSFPVMEHWDPSLALVIIFGVLPNLVEIQSKGFGCPPLFADKFSVSTKTFRDVDTNFIVGSAMFGVGWGLTGTCPGTAVLRALAQPTWGVLWMGGFWLGSKMFRT